MDMIGLFGDLGVASQVGATSFDLGDPQTNQLAQSRYNTLIGQGIGQNDAASMASAFALGQTSQGLQITNTGSSSDIFSQFKSWASNYFLGTPTAEQLQGIASGATKTLDHSVMQNGGLGPQASKFDLTAWIGRGAVIIVGMVFVAGALYLFGSGAISSSITDAISSVQNRIGKGK